MNIRFVFVFCALMLEKGFSSSMVNKLPIIFYFGLVQLKNNIKLSFLKFHIIHGYL